MRSDTLVVDYSRFDLEGLDNRLGFASRLESMAKAACRMAQDEGFRYILFKAGNYPRRHGFRNPTTILRHLLRSPEVSEFVFLTHKVYEDDIWTVEVKPKRVHPAFWVHARESVM
jgi:hypothetical protein